MMVYAAHKIFGLSWGLNEFIYVKRVKQSWVLIRNSCSWSQGTRWHCMSVWWLKTHSGWVIPTLVFRDLRKGLRGFRLKGLSDLSQPIIFCPDFAGQISREVLFLCLQTCDTLAWGLWRGSQQLSGLKGTLPSLNGPLSFLFSSVSF